MDLQAARSPIIDRTIIDTLDLESTTSSMLDCTRLKLDDLEERVAKALQRTRMEFEPRTSGALERIKLNGFHSADSKSTTLGRLGPSRRSLSRYQKSFDDIDLDYRPSRDQC